MLDRLAAGPPIGTVRAERAAGRPGTRRRRRHLGALAGGHLLVAIADDTVELPREIGAAAAPRDRAAGPAAPAAAGGRRRVPVRHGVDSAGAGQAMEAVRQIEALLQALADEPAAVLRTGGLGVRDLRRLAKDAGITEPVAALLLEVGVRGRPARRTDPDRRAVPGLPVRSGCYDPRCTTVVAASTATVGPARPGPGSS